MWDLMAQNVVHLGWFVLAGVLLNLTPGPDVLYILSHAMRRHAGAFKAGVWASLGIITGCWVHVTLAALGLGALLATSAQAFALVKAVGAAYLVYLGIQSWRSAAAVGGPTAQAAGPEPRARVFFKGLLTNVLNPKVVLFFLAFLPQFIAPGAPNPEAAFWFLGAVFCLNSLVFCLVVARSAAWLAQRWSSRALAKAWVERITGTVFMGLGLRLALTQSPQS